MYGKLLVHLILWVICIHDTPDNLYSTNNNDSTVSKTKLVFDVSLTHSPFQFLISFSSTKNEAKDTNSHNSNRTDNATTAKL